MRKELIKHDTITITIDTELKGLGIMSFKDDDAISITLSVFIIHCLFVIKRTRGKQMIQGTYDAPFSVKVGDKYYPIRYYTEYDKRYIYYRDKTGEIIQSYDYEIAFDEEWYIIKRKHDAILVNRGDIWLFKPYSKVKGYIRGNDFIALEEIQ